jgi:hypothetical protein
MSSTLLERRKQRPETAKSHSNLDESSALGRKKSEYAFDGGKSVIIDAPLSPCKLILL